MIPMPNAVSRTFHLMRGAGIESMRTESLSSDLMRLRLDVDSEKIRRKRNGEGTLRRSSPRTTVAAYAIVSKWNYHGSCHRNGDWAGGRGRVRFDSALAKHRPLSWRGGRAP